MRMTVKPSDIYQAILQRDILLHVKVQCVLLRVGYVSIVFYVCKFTAFQSCTLLVSSQEGHLACVDWSFARRTASVVTITSIILSFDKTG